VFDGCIQRQWLQAAWSALSVVRTCPPDRRVVIFPGIDPRGIFLGEPEQTITQSRIGGIAGKPTATLGLFTELGLFAEMEELRHPTHSQRGGSPIGLSVAGAVGVLAGNAAIVSRLCRVSDSIR
jgi:hypothetical protein